MTHRPLVYVARPLTAYGTARERQALAAIGRHFVGWEIIDPAIRYQDSNAWRRDWPALAPTLDALAVFGAGRASTVGAGVMVELADVMRLGVPVYLVDRAGALRELSRLVFVPFDERFATRVARAIGGPIVRVPELD